ncbi:MAG: 3'-5' exonuclease [bacterium]|nr:3'-5' exonuclease [bacterium]
MLGLKKKVVLFDIECTTWEGAAARDWSGPGEHRELVQLGAAIVETKSFTEISTFSFLVKPRINPVLSDYFINLTGITQEQIEGALNFSVVLEIFRYWCKGYQMYTFDKVGSSRLFDRDVLVENCDLYGIEFPFDLERFHNINEIFHRHGYAVKQSGAAPEAFGVKPPARSHDALNDVRGLILGLKLLSERIK